MCVFFGFVVWSCAGVIRHKHEDDVVIPTFTILQKCASDGLLLQAEPEVVNSAVKAVVDAMLYHQDDTAIVVCVLTKQKIVPINKLLDVRVIKERSFC